MDTLTFLRHVLPTTGPYVICQELTYADDKRAYRQFAYHDLSVAAQHAIELEQGTRNIFFAVGALIEGPQWDEQKQKYGKPSRAAKNIRALRSYIIDIDVGPTKQYPTIADAVTALRAFCTGVKLPKPTIVRSGGGLHVYFTLDAEVPAAEWRSYGELIKQVAVAEGLKIDSARSADVSSVLRVVGTHNYKYSPPPEVEVLVVGQDTSTAAFHQLLTVRVGSVGLIGTSTADFGSNTTVLKPSVLSFRKMVERCNQFQQAGLPDKQKGVPEPIWSMCIQLATLMKDGRKAAHDISKYDSRYSEDYVDKTFDRYTGRGPTRCDTFQEYQAGAGVPNLCVDCPSYGKITSPAQITRQDEDAPPLVVTEIDEEGNTVEREFAPPPLPEHYYRDARGMAILTANNKTGSSERYIFCDYDMYPVRLRYNERTMLEDDVEWAVKLPKEGWITMHLPQGTPQQQLKSTLAKRGLYLNSNNIVLMDTFMTSYMRKLQTELSREKTLTKYGWRDEGGFALGNAIYLQDGTIEPHGASTELLHATHNGVMCGGSLEKWKEAVQIYNRPRQEGQRVILYSSFGSILFTFTGQVATFVSASGPTGTGKSTLLECCASVWGDQRALIIRGGKHGYTRTGAEIATDALHNLPLCMDEITKRDPEEMAEFIFNYSGGRGKIRGKAGGGLRTDTATWSNLALCNSNTDEYERMLSIGRENMQDMVRLVQINLSHTNAVTKDEADKARAMFWENYGWAGVEFIKYVAPRLEEIKQTVVRYGQEIGAAAKGTSAERYWIAWAACQKLGGEIAVQLDLLSRFPIAADALWTIKQIESMRSIVHTHVVSPLELLSEFMDAINANTLILSANAGNINNVVQGPRGELMARREVDTGLVTFSAAALRSYCFKLGINYSRICAELRKQGVFLNEGVLRTIGAQTPYATGQVRCFVVDQKQLGVTLRLVNPQITPIGGTATAN